MFFCFGTTAPKRADMKSKYGRITSRGKICRGIFCKKCSKICNAQNLNGLMIGNYAAKIPDGSVNKPAVYIIFSVY